MSRRPSVLFDIACVALSVSEIASRAATIQSRRVLGERAVKRDWYGNEIGVKAADYSAEPRSNWASEEHVPAEQETTPLKFGSSSAAPSVTLDTPPPAPKPPPNQPLINSMQNLETVLRPIHPSREGPFSPPFVAPVKPTASTPADFTPLPGAIPAETPLVTPDLSSTKDNLLLKASKQVNEPSLPRHAPPPPRARAPLADIEDDRV